MPARPARHHKTPIRGKARRGQAEVIGGLIVLTILVILILPIILSSLTDIRTVSEDIRDIETRIDIKLKEKLEIRGVAQDELSPDLWPAFWIANTGTVQVTLRTVYLISKSTGNIIVALDMSKARDGTPSLIKRMYLNPDETLTSSDPLPPPGTYITLKPGDRLLVVLDGSDPALGDPSDIIIRVLSSKGVLHPLGGGGVGQGELVPPEQGEPAEPWRGAFNPYAGFKFEGGNELLQNGILKLFLPAIKLVEPIDTPFFETFIYDDDRYPGLYRITLVPSSDIIIDTNFGLCQEGPNYVIEAGDFVELRGFIGTYNFYTDPYDGDNHVYIYGYAAQILVNGIDCFGDQGIITLDPSNTFELSDFDANGVEELVLYTLRNGPNYSTTLNNDADSSGLLSDDTVVWSYMATRDISGQNFIRITAKINYYWTRIISGEPIDIARNLRIFMITVWEYDELTGTWKLRHYKDFSYTNEKPKQFQFSAVFPLDSTRKYRIGFLFFDSYRYLERYYGSEVYGTSPWNRLDRNALEFTFGLEYIVVEYGRYNPLFSTTPPVYIVAIPDPYKINEIGEGEYAAINGLTPSDAKIQAQQELLAYTIETLDQIGILDYVIISSTTELCTILFGSPDLGLPDTPPRKAVIIWLQGSASISDVTYDPSTGSSCADDNTLISYMEAYNWVFVQISGEPLWGSLSLYTGSPTAIYIALNPSPNTADLTSFGALARLNYRTFLIPVTAEFKYMFDVNNYTGCIPTYTDPSSGSPMELVFYKNSNTGLYGTLGFWVECNSSGSNLAIVAVNPADVDWNLDGGGMSPNSLIQTAITIGLESYRALLQALP